MRQDVRRLAGAEAGIALAPPDFLQLRPQAKQADDDEDGIEAAGEGVEGRGLQGISWMAEAGRLVYTFNLATCSHEINCQASNIFRSDDFAHACLDAPVVALAPIITA